MDALIKENLPKHVGIIMDGNGRWAVERGMSRTAGHQVGADSVRSVIETAISLKLPKLSLFAFSEENWLRPAHEVRLIMSLLLRYLKKEKKKLHEQNVKLSFSGQQEKLQPALLKELQLTEAQLEKNTGMHLHIALSYSSRTEIVNACKQIAKSCLEGKLIASDIDTEVFSTYLYQSEFAELDFLIRTSGEQRLSNFMLWQSAYAELYFTDTLWPDFREADFKQALTEFAHRNRRFGRVIPIKKGLRARLEAL